MGRPYPVENLGRVSPFSLFQQALKGIDPLSRLVKKVGEYASGVLGRPKNLGKEEKSDEESDYPAGDESDPAGEFRC